MFSEKYQNAKQFVKSENISRKNFLQEFIICIYKKLELTQRTVTYEIEYLLRIRREFFASLKRLLTILMQNINV